MQLEQADSRVAQADAQLESAYQDLIIRVARRYFVVLGAMDNLEFVQSDKAAIARTLDQAKQRFEVGLAAITDVYEAQARYDTAVSEEISAEIDPGKTLEIRLQAVGETHEEDGSVRGIDWRTPVVVAGGRSGEKGETSE